MLILAIDTCLARCAVCLFDSAAGSVLAEHHLDIERGHAEALAPMVQRVLATAHKRPGDVTRIALTLGPGTFTGVRIGLSFARAFGLALNIPVYGLDTLTAYQLHPDAPNPIAIVSGNSGLAFVLRRGRPAIELLPLGEVDDASFASSTPDLHLLSGWAAQQAHTIEMPKPVYIREPDAKPQVSIKKSISAASLSSVHQSAFSHGWSEQDFTSMLEVRGTRAFSAEINSQVVGITLTRTIADQCELLTIAINPTWRKHGAAAKLLRSAQDDATAHGATTMFLEVAHTNQAAMQLYAKAGFVKTGLRKGYYSNGDDAVLMARRLP